ncbi:arginine deiminase family protein [Luminiphilus sp.]|nr:arginine deiminase family protein [Luminiphilus sp.]MDB2351915.1 arginine deiminase family protein [Luminiphilus sp.]MDB2377098.1 arginine deiminase family protein [Luminiphilus sp.]
MANLFSMRTREEQGKTPVLSTWGADSETGILRDVLIGPVDHFQNILPTNSVNRKMIRDGVTLDVEGARMQYEEMLSCYRDAGVEVHITPADPDLPLQIWARDGSFMTPWGMIIGQMAQWWRRGEYGPVFDLCYDKDIAIYDKVTAGCYEGGDFMMIKPGHALMGYSGERSQLEGALQVQRWLNAEGWECYLYEFDPFFVHMDVMSVMLTDKLAAVCTEILDPAVIDWFHGLGIDTIEVPYSHALKMGCNVVSLGDDRVLLPKESTFLVDRCKALGLKVYDPDISEISICGGGVHCMCQPLRRDSYQGGVA